MSDPVRMSILKKLAIVTVSLVILLVAGYQVGIKMIESKLQKFGNERGIEVKAKVIKIRPWKVIFEDVTLSNGKTLYAGFGEISVGFGKDLSPEFIDIQKGNIFLDGEIPKSRSEGGNKSKSIPITIDGVDIRWKNWRGEGSYLEALVVHGKRDDNDKDFRAYSMEIEYGRYEVKSKGIHISVQPEGVVVQGNEVDVKVKDADPSSTGNENGNKVFPEENARVDLKKVSVELGEKKFEWNELKVEGKTHDGSLTTEAQWGEFRNEIVKTGKSDSRLVANIGDKSGRIEFKTEFLSATNEKISDGEAQLHDVEGNLTFSIGEKKNLSGNITIGKLNTKVELKKSEDSWSAEANVSTMPCEEALESSSGVLTRLDGMKMSGDFAVHLKVENDWGEPRVEFKMVNQCKIIKAPEDFKISGLRGGFERKAWDANGKEIVVRSGVNSDGWTSLRDISPYMVMAVETTEDPGFEKHRGIDQGAISNALKADVKDRKFSRGASTITMQLAKNLWLDRKKNLARKLEEAALATYIEQELRKDEILELYLNVVEFAPGVYGIGQATKYYFKTSPKDLTLSQSLFLSLMLPRPKGHFFGPDGRATEGRTGLIRSLSKALMLKKSITEEEYSEVLKERVVKDKARPEKEKSGIPGESNEVDATGWE